VVTIDGIVADLAWRNPHFYVTLESEDANGETVVAQEPVELSLDGGGFGILVSSPQPFRGAPVPNCAVAGEILAALELRVGLLGSTGTIETDLQEA
jgi:hypothetical protein